MLDCVLVQASLFFLLGVHEALKNNGNKQVQEDQVDKQEVAVEVDVANSIDTASHCLIAIIHIVLVSWTLDAGIIKLVVDKHCVHDVVPVVSCGHNKESHEGFPEVLEVDHIVESSCDFEFCKEVHSHDWVQVQAQSQKTSYIRQSRQSHEERVKDDLQTLGSLDQSQDSSHSEGSDYAGSSFEVETGVGRDEDADERPNHDNEVEDVPSFLEVVLVNGYHLHDHL